MIMRDSYVKDMKFQFVLATPYTYTLSTATLVQPQNIINNHQAFKTIVCGKYVNSLDF